MATIYRFVVENKTSGGGTGGRKDNSGESKKGAGKKGRKTVTLLGSMKGGVEHNRKTRAINPLLNKATGGYWEKGMRLGRAGLGLVKFDAATGAIAGLSFTALAIMVSFAIQTVLKVQQKQLAEQNKINEQNFKALENGLGAVHGEYSVSRNAWNGRVNYNQNK